MRNYYELKKTTPDSQLDFVGNMTHIEPNDISIIFFRDETVDKINNLLIEEIKKITLEKYGRKIAIQPQRKNAVLTIMRYIFFKNVKNKCSVEKEVNDLINKTVELMVPTVFQSLVHHIKYINDYNENRFIIPLERPQDVNNEKSLDALMRS
jgi:NhaP-type Na+/H+ and K+/H+ antiporter